MLLDPQEGLYVFEVTLGFNAEGAKHYTTPYLIQADDLEEAEEKILELLDDLDLDQDLWIEEMSEPFEIEDYTQHIEEGDSEPFPMLSELTEEEFKDMLGY
jgi:cobalamin biosynthesis Mg chelatase CobN